MGIRQDWTMILKLYFRKIEKEISSIIQFLKANENLVKIQKNVFR